MENFSTVHLAVEEELRKIRSACRPLEKGNREQWNGRRLKACGGKNKMSRKKDDGVIVISKRGRERCASKRRKKGRRIEGRDPAHHCGVSQKSRNYEQHICKWGKFETARTT